MTLTSPNANILNNLITSQYNTIELKIKISELIGELLLKKSINLPKYFIFNVYNLAKSSGANKIKIDLKGIASYLKYQYGINRFRTENIRTIKRKIEEDNSLYVEWIQKPIESKKNERTFYLMEYIYGMNCINLTYKIHKGTQKTSHKITEKIQDLIDDIENEISQSEFII